MSGPENDVVFARLKSLQDNIKNLKPGKSDATVVAVVQEALGFLAACSVTDVVAVALKVLEDGLVLSPQAGTILRLEGGLKQVVRHLKAAPNLAAVVGPCARILAVAAATSNVTQQALAKEKGLGAMLLNACCLHVHDPAIAGPLCEAMAHISKAPKGAVQLECDAALPVLQELLVSYLGNWPVFGWVLKIMKNLAKYEYTQYGGAAMYGTWAAAGGAGAAGAAAGGVAAAAPHAVPPPSLTSPFAPYPSSTAGAGQAVATLPYGSPSLSLYPITASPQVTVPASSQLAAQPLYPTSATALAASGVAGGIPAGIGSSCYSQQQQHGSGLGAPLIPSYYLAGNGGCTSATSNGTAAAAAAGGFGAAAGAAAAGGAAALAAAAAAGGGAVLDAARGGTGVLSATGEGVRLLLGVARVLARIPEQKKLLKRCSRAVWLLCPHVLVPLPPLEPLVPLPPKDVPHLAGVMSAGEADPARHAELFPEEYPWQQRPLPPPPPPQQLQQQPLAAALAQLLPPPPGPHGGHHHGPYHYPQQQQQQQQAALSSSSRAQAGAAGFALPPSAKQLCRSLAAASLAAAGGGGGVAVGNGGAYGAGSGGDAPGGAGGHYGGGGVGAAGGPYASTAAMVAGAGAGGGCTATGNGGRSSSSGSSSGSTTAGGAAAAAGGGSPAGTLGLMPEPFHGYGSSLDCEMVLHDLHRILNPRALVNRIVYLNTAAAPSTATTSTSGGSNSSSMSSGGGGGGGGGSGCGSGAAGYFPHPYPAPSYPNGAPVAGGAGSYGLQQQHPGDTSYGGAGGWPSWNMDPSLGLLLPRRPGSGSGHGAHPGSRSGTGCGSSGQTDGAATIGDLQPGPPGPGPGSGSRAGSGNGSRTGSRSGSGSRPGSGPHPYGSSNIPVLQMQPDPFHLPNINADPWTRSTTGGGGSGSGSGALLPPPSPPLSRYGITNGNTAVLSPPAGLVPPSASPLPPPPPLMFHSGFESGNLRCAAQVGPREYDLFLAPDINDRSEGGNMCQWFYFAVTVPPEACSSSTSAAAAAVQQGGGGGTIPYSPVVPSVRGGGGAAGIPPSGDAAAAAASAAAAAAAGVGAAGTVLDAAAAAAGATTAGPGAWANRPGIKLNIVNLRKKESLFSVGKRPVMCLVRPMGPPPPMTHGSYSASPSPVPGAAAVSAAVAAARNAVPRPPLPTTNAAAAMPQAAEPGCWIRVGSHISYYPSPYRGRPTVAGEGAATRRGKKPSAAVLAASAAAAAGSGTGGGGAATGTGATAASPSSGGKKLKSTKASKAAAAAAAAAASAAAAEAAAAAAAAANGDGDVPVGVAAAAASSQTGVGPGLYCATFTVHFPVPGTYYIASCYPYTYTDLQEHLDGLQRRLAYEAFTGSSNGTNGLGPAHLPPYASSSFPVPPSAMLPSAAAAAGIPPSPAHLLPPPPPSSSSSSSLASASLASLPQSSSSTASGASSSSFSYSSAASSSFSIQQHQPPQQPFPPPQPGPPRISTGGAANGTNGNTNTSTNGPPPLVRSLLCYSLGGLRCDLITITDWSSPLEAVRQRECIFITARVHAGETCASWLMQGILDFLVSSDPAAATLRNSFVFKLVPMLNPDGVVAGNYRCNLAGVDLNRLWDRPARHLHPTIYHSKRLLQQLAAAGRLALYIDLHGHSTKQDTFFYGCEPTAAVLQAHAGAGGGGTRAATAAAAAQQPTAYARAAAAANGTADADGGAPASSSGMPSMSPSSSAAAPPQSTGGASGGSNPFPGGLGVQGVGYSASSGGSASQQQQQQSSGAAAAAAAAGSAATSAGGPAVAPPPPAAGPNPRVAARLRVRMLPYLTARISSDFSFPKCNFKIRKAKLSAARVVVHRELGVAGSYTLEASLAGSSSGMHFGARDYLAMGHSLCRAICELAEVDDTALLEEMNARVVLGPL